MAIVGGGGGRQHHHDDVSRADDGPRLDDDERAARPRAGPMGGRRERKPGTSAWRLAPGTRPGTIEGYADRVSAVAGESVGLFVSTTELTFQVEAYRMGFYQGQGARRVWTSGPIPGIEQARPDRDAATNMVEARWSKSLAFDVDDTWPPGADLLKLVADGVAQRYVPLTVRDDESIAAIVVQSSVTTWQAYNHWGGYSLYEGGSGFGSDERRARVVSFDRPYAAKVRATSSGWSCRS